MIANNYTTIKYINLIDMPFPEILLKSIHP